MRRRFDIWLLLAAIVGFVGGGGLVWGVLRAPPKQYAAQNQQTQSSAPEKEHKHGFWEKAADDPVAYFTLWLVGFTGVLAVSTIGLWVVTWRASASQARDMQSSIAAAQASAEATQRSGDYFATVERAWIFAPGADSEGASGTDESGRTFEGRRFFLNIINVGHTPAVRADIYSDHRVIDFNEPIPTFSPIPDREVWQVSVAPGVQARSRPRYIQNADIEAIQRREKKLLLYGRLTYFTMFDPDVERFTEVCLEAHFEGHAVRNDTGERFPFFLYTAVGPQNTFS